MTDQWAQDTELQICEQSGAAFDIAWFAVLGIELMTADLSRRE